MRIAIAHDDDRFCSQLKKLLEGQSHAVETLKLDDSAASVLARLPHDLLVLSCTVPAGCARLIQDVRARAEGRRLPILCVNPLGRSADGVALLDAGADDFINRPFNGQIFLARVRTLLRRGVWSGFVAEDEQATYVENGGVRLQLVSRRASVDGRPLELTRLEFDLLAYLVRSPERAFSRQELLEAVWNYPHDVETRTLDKHIETLRRKLGAQGARIATVHGHGYRLTADVPRLPPRAAR